MPSNGWVAKMLLGLSLLLRKYGFGLGSSEVLSDWALGVRVGLVVSVDAIDELHKLQWKKKKKNSLDRNEIFINWWSKNQKA